jgi:hypothetical protein
MEYRDDTPHPPSVCANHAGEELKKAKAALDGALETITKQRKAPAHHADYEVWKKFHDLGWTEIWYANPGGSYHNERFGPRFHAGVMTGQDYDLVCLKHCTSKEDAERWLSPEGWTPVEAVLLAIEKFEHLSKGKKVCQRCGFVGMWKTSEKPHLDWCDNCERELDLKLAQKR